jgi:hypothetical protein
MISEPNIAKQISELMLDIFRRVDESVLMVNESCQPEEAAAYSKAAGRVACAAVMDVLGPLYELNLA